MRKEIAIAASKIRKGDTFPDDPEGWKVTEVSRTDDTIYIRSEGFVKEDGKTFLRLEGSVLNADTIVEILRGNAS